jgi:hypothetical protein
MFDNFACGDDLVFVISFHMCIVAEQRRKVKPMG